MLKRKKNGLIFQKERNKRSVLDQNLGVTAKAADLMLVVVETMNVVTKTRILRRLYPGSWILQFDDTRLPPGEFCFVQRVSSQLFEGLEFSLGRGCAAWLALNLRNYA